MDTTHVLYKNIILALKEQKCIIEKDIKLHEKSYSYYRKIYSYINITNIILLGAITLTKLINEFLKEVYIISITTTIILFFNSILTAVIHFLEYEKIAEQHLTKSNAYKSIFLSIKRQLIVPSQNLEEYYSWVSKKYDELATTGPLIPGYINYKTKNNSNSNLNEDPESCMDIKTESISSESSNSEIINIETEEQRYQIDRFMEFT